ncbi:MAG: hypothetical protein J3R72DRAFT_455295 [Linnemannia gamsii]|nr:MAG: hypothetical protein J3R72DRAFT_455295 [Linnemannia gamsii]
MPFLPSKRVPTTPTTTRALNLPEILLRVGQFLPLWIHQAGGSGGSKEDNNDLAQRYEFKPQTIAACLLVSKYWHKILLPILWHTYRSVPMWKVPQQILSQHSVHLRILHAQLYELDTFRCTGLVELTVPQQPLEMEAQRCLVRTNPGLKVLRWHGPLQKVAIEAEDFRGLTRIHTLELAHWEGSGDILGKVLQAVAGSLVRLELGCIQGTASNMGLAAETSNALCTKNNYAEIVMPRLETFVFTNSQPRGPDPTDIVQCCPKLKILDLTLTSDIDITRLADTLANCCPTLDALTIRESRRLQLCETLLQQLGDPHHRQKLNLVHLTVSQTALTKNLTSAIILHAQNLESLSILVQDVDNYDLIDASMVTAFLPLYECRRLKSFSLVVSNRRILSRAILEGFQVDRWVCKGIEQLSLDFMRPTYEGRWGSCTTAKNAFKEGCSSSVMGWRLCPEEKGEKIGGAYTLTVHKGFFEGLFDAVKGLGKLKVIKWNKLAFEQAAFGEKSGGFLI